MARQLTVFDPMDAQQKPVRYSMRFMRCDAEQFPNLVKQIQTNEGVVTRAKKVGRFFRVHFCLPFVDITPARGLFE
jgi:cell division FtsZ-interacting protein ZapD